MTAEEIVTKFEELGGRFWLGQDGLPQANYFEMGMNAEETLTWRRIFGRHRDRIIEILQQREAERLTPADP